MDALDPNDANPMMTAIIVSVDGATVALDALPLQAAPLHRCVVIADSRGGIDFADAALTVVP